jgi:hypothetical protein
VFPLPVERDHAMPEAARRMTLRNNASGTLQGKPDR